MVTIERKIARYKVSYFGPLCISGKKIMSKGEGTSVKNAIKAWQQKNKISNPAEEEVVKLGQPT